MTTRNRLLLLFAILLVGMLAVGYFSKPVSPPDMCKIYG